MATTRSKSKAKKTGTNIIETRTYEVFIPVPTGARCTPLLQEVMVTHRQEVMTVHTVELAACNSSDDGVFRLWERWPSIPAELWQAYSGEEPLLVVERPGWAPYLVYKAEIDAIHEEPIPSIMDEILYPVARDEIVFPGDRTNDRDEWLVYLELSEVFHDKKLIWGEGLVPAVERAYGRGTPANKAEYIQAMKKVPRVKAILDTFFFGHPVPLPFLRWTYGQSIILANTKELLRGAGEEGRLDEMFAVEIVVNGYNNHW